MNVFVYGDAETAYLKERDKKLGAAIDTIGPIRREVFPDFFSALVNSIVGQQISTKAHMTVWKRIKSGLVEITPQKILACTESELQSYGITFKKVSYIRDAAEMIEDGRLDIDALRSKTDKEVCKELVQINGVGIWTAEMLMLFSMQRQDILSYGDLAILRGMRMLYRHRKITRQIFEKYRRRYSPHGSVASLYLWAIAGGALESGLPTPPPL
ncbi:MAG: DNA-3-methyladenine glycosylase 2 family protein [Treponema sp.]|nr:DNA-3-methyladenine glycosylase 2 family protein [Treponema sp.]